MINPSSGVSLHSNLPHDSSSSEGEEDRLQRKEEEEERLLSRQYGEASETTSTNRNNKKRSHQTDAEIAQALKYKSSSTNDEEGLVKKKKKRVVLDESKLTGSRGLIYIRREFPSSLKYNDPKKKMMKKKPSRSSSKSQREAWKQKQFEMEINASASYLSSLMKSYQRFANEIAPNMHHTDTFRKIQDLGSKKQVRDYLDTMREEVCKEHMGKVYGVKRTEKLMHELEYGLKAHKESLLDNNKDGIVAGAANNSTEGESLTLNNLRASRQVGILVENTGDENYKPTETPDTSPAVEDEKESNDEDISTGASYQMKNNEKKEDTNDETSEDEEVEATFDEEIESKKNEDNILEKITKDDRDEISLNDSVSSKNAKMISEKDEEESLNEKLTQSQETETQMQVVLDVSQNIEETQTIIPDMTQNSSTSLIFDATQSFDETQTIVPTLTAASQESNIDFFSQEY